MIKKYRCHGLHSVSALMALHAMVLFMLIISTDGIAARDLRIKDIVSLEGVRSNQLVGYGLVVGLPGTGDRLNNAPFTQRSLSSMLERLGISVNADDIRTRNVAAVMVTAMLPAFANAGSRLDVQIAALGDASSLLGGTLLVTPLLGADGDAYALAQGPVLVAGFNAQGEAASVSKGVPTNARIPNGAVVEKEVDFTLDDVHALQLSLRNPDFTTAIRIADRINGEIGSGVAHPSDAATVDLAVPRQFHGNVVRFIAAIETLTVITDQIARVVVDERSGTILIGENVRVSRVAITQGSIMIEVNETPVVSQPAPFSETGETTVLQRSRVRVTEQQGGGFRIVEEGTTLQDLVNGLNVLGVQPRDTIAILQAIKSAGALHADLIVE